jgi:hypothetical protein
MSTKETKGVKQADEHVVLPLSNFQNPAKLPVFCSELHYLIF